MYRLTDRCLECVLQLATEDYEQPFIEGLQEAMENNCSDSVVCVECGDLVKLSGDSEFEATSSAYRMNVFFRVDEIEWRPDELDDDDLDDEDLDDEDLDDEDLDDEEIDDFGLDPINVLR